MRGGCLGFSRTGSGWVWAWEEPSWMKSNHLKRRCLCSKAQNCLASFLFCSSSAVDAGHCFSWMLKYLIQNVIEKVWSDFNKVFTTFERTE